MRVSQGRVLVTGASRGIGRAVVACLVKNGARVAAVGRDEDALMQVARTASKQITAVVGDLAREPERERPEHCTQRPCSPAAAPRETLTHSLLYKQISAKHGSLRGYLIMLGHAGSSASSATSSSL